MDDLQTLSIQAQSKEDLATIVTLLFRHIDRKSQTIIGYSESKGEEGEVAISLHFDTDKDMIRLPYKMRAEQTIEFLWGWLDAQGLKDHPGYEQFSRDMDGWVEKGWWISADLFSVYNTIILTMGIRLVGVAQ